MKVAVIDYGAGNVFSVVTALQRLGAEVAVTADAGRIKDADRVVFPGVGQAASAMERLRATGLDEVIPYLGQPVLGVCLGMQLMCRSSQEGDVRGLGIFPLESLRFPGGAKVPHMGWNNITGLRTGLFAGLEEGAWMYFVHSYYVPTGDFTAAACRYGLPFSAALSRDNFFGCQFHPEKSSGAGIAILRNFLSKDIERKMGL